MKTNQLMIRKMGKYDVLQRTSDGMFNATNLLNQWNKDNSDKIRDMDNFWKTSRLNELMSEIAVNELHITSVDFTYLKNSFSRTSKARIDRGGGTWMHPVLFVKFAMYLNSRFEYHVLKFVSDEMVKYRDEAGDAYRELGAAIMKIVPRDFMPTAMKKIGEAINWVIFGSHEKLIRNKHGEENMQRELCQFERKITDLINDGFISEFDKLIDYMRDQYIKRHRPSIF